MGDRYAQGAVIAVLVLFHFFPRNEIRNGGMVTEGTKNTKAERVVL